jgi:hypothetical protein
MEFPITARRADDSYVSALEAGFACRKGLKTGGLMGVGPLAISVIAANTTRPTDATRLLG